MDDEITYFFGAGASRHSMPLVDDFKERFDAFRSLVFQFEFKAKEDFRNICNDFSDQLEMHASFDTYFKKLFHQDMESEILRKKAILLLFFIYEHLYNPNQPRKIRIPKKKGTLDPRYEALIAGLLQPQKKPEFYRRINFVTWNYDLNLLFALRNFFLPGSDLNRFIESNTVDDNHIKLENHGVNVFHLNGLIRHPRLGTITEISVSDLKSFMSGCIDEYFDGKKELFALGSGLSFSWEALNQAKKQGKGYPDYVKNAQKAIHNSKYIIIIGYSFPFYNRQIDTYLLNNDTLRNKFVTIQDPLAQDYIEIMNTDFEIELLESGGVGTSFKSNTNEKSFSLPSSALKTP